MAISKRFVSLFFLAAVSISLYCNETPAYADSDSRNISPSGNYVGQSPPGSYPVKFAPGIISVQNRFEHSGAVFNSDLTEVYWAAKPSGDSIFHIYFMKYVNGKWAEPEMLPCTSRYEGNRPTFSPDEQRLYYQTIRNPVGGPILYVERVGDGWSDPKPVTSIVNSASSVRLFSLTRNGSLYFARGYSLSEDEELLVSHFVDGDFTDPIVLDPKLNSHLSELAIFVAPDESYMIIESSDHVGYSELVISYRMNDGTWSERITIPFRGLVRFPVVSPDGKYLFFMGYDGIYWVDTLFIDNLRPEQAD